MNESSRQRAVQIFLEISNLPASEQHDAAVRLCGNEEDVLNEVRAMLHASNRSGSLTDTPTVTSSGAPGAPESLDIRAPLLEHAAIEEQPGSHIGPFKLLQLIGEGGFGSVFLAEQLRPVQRRVALKIIKLGMDTRQVVARFEQERQALALMDHPNIARVFDAGATITGRPYFVMELCRGQSITEYCDKHNLSIRDRLSLFVQVCQAVQHAHQKGLIHRDIKPSNILVSEEAGRHSAKVIDFGIAKATASKLTEKTLFTEQAQMVGTPQYMSPEQAEGSLDIDTRTDVYALGVLLYELLTGVTPFDPKSLRSAGYAEIQRIIREVEPPKPSTRLSTNADTVASVAAQRHTEPRKLGTMIRGELDWIAMKALEKDRARRYETANGLAMDVQRYLAGEPVVAAPSSQAYRMRKFIRRHRVKVTAAALVALALVLGLAGTMWQAKLAKEQAVIAKRAAEEAKTARDGEKARADELKKVSDFQEKMLADIDTNKAGANLMSDLRDRYAAVLEKDGVAVPERSTRATAFGAELARVNATDAAATLIDRTILKPAVTAIDEQFKDQPAVNAQLREALAILYHNIGLYDAAYPLQKTALETRQRVLGPDHPDTILSLNQMGILLRSQTRDAEAERYYREALDRGRRVLGQEHPDTLAFLINVGAVIRDQGKYTEAEPYFREALEKFRRVRGADHSDTLHAIRNLAFLLYVQGRFADAEPLFREILEKRRRLFGDDKWETLLAVNDMSAVLREQGKLDEAEPYYREALERGRRVLGEEHPRTIGYIHGMGFLLYSQNKLDEVEPYWREALEKSRRVLGDDHTDTLEYMNSLGALYRAQNKFAQAEPYYREVIEKRRRILGADHLSTLDSLNNMGTLLNDQQRFPEAEACHRQVLEGRRRGLGEEHPMTLLSVYNLGTNLLSQGKLDEAESLLIPGSAIALEKLPPKHKTRGLFLQGLVRLYKAKDKAEPGQGYDAKTAEWEAKLEQWQATTRPSSKPASTEPYRNPPSSTGPSK